MSIPVTLSPRLASSNESLPFPHGTSRTWRARLAVESFDQEICLSFGLFRRNGLTPQIERNAVKKIFVPVGWNKTCAVCRV
jgi:hypothetical protein